MTDAEISRRLALAIGWQEHDFYKDGDGSFVALALKSGFGHFWRTFDYTDPAIIWPIAERFDCFPMRDNEHWYAFVPPDGSSAQADTAAKAVALAVIKSKESP